MVTLSSNTLLLPCLEARESIRPERCEPIPSPATHQRLTHSKEGISFKDFKTGPDHHGSKGKGL